MIFHTPLVYIENRSKIEYHFDMKTVYERIKEVRLKAKLSQVEFAERILLSKSFYGDLEIGKKNVNKRILFIVSKQFGISLNWLNTGQGEIYENPQSDQRKERLMFIYDQLDNSLKECLVEQSNILFKLQKNKS